MSGLGATFENFVMFFMHLLVHLIFAFLIRIVK